MALFLKKNEYDSIVAVSELLEAHKPLFTGGNLETVDEYLNMVKVLSARRRVDQIRHAETAREYRSNPATRDRTKEIDRRALAKFRSKGKKK